MARIGCPSSNRDRLKRSIVGKVPHCRVAQLQETFAMPDRTYHGGRAVRRGIACSPYGCAGASYHGVGKEKIIKNAVSIRTGLVKHACPMVSDLARLVMATGAATIVERQGPFGWLD
ncbi:MULTISPECIES: hypothetical protein [unclassified Novosphingobium]|uniref:hypothetical protein n=1 Tax=unclassified Novosphingobium TaxID=2644732 RepID=UPI00146EC989|nr:MULTISPECIES: hypothetical protein [unclassified Novosphingobium]NMN04808.1 hypothetical protein [Novosphingobium sp. SG919]NMN85198.1 hypothetical protein [Novosphingobium sp. SG916]